jgi:hypothetical protein
MGTFLLQQVTHDSASAKFSTNSHERVNSAYCIYSMTDISKLRGEIQMIPESVNKK